MLGAKFEDDFNILGNGRGPILFLYMARTQLFYVDKRQHQGFPGVRCRDYGMS